MWSTFPCWAWDSEKPIDLKHFVHSFQESQPSDRWVFCGNEVAQTPRQLWTAAVVSSRNIERSTAQARTLEAEFLRVLAGTHNVSEAFKRAGLAQGTQSGWLLHIPNIDQPLNHDDVSSSAQSLLTNLGLTKKEAFLQINPNGAEKLGIALDGETEAIRIEAALIGHILLADVNTTQ